MAGQRDTIEFTADGQVIAALTAGPGSPQRRTIRGRFSSR